MKHKKHLRKQNDGSANDEEADDRAQVNEIRILFNLISVKFGKKCSGFKQSTTISDKLIYDKIHFSKN
jgi:hypothetical protein